MSRSRPAPVGRGPGRSALRILITGASRGLGLEFTRRYLERGERIFATCRRPDSARGLHALRAGHRERLSIVPLDVSDADSIRAAHRAVRRETDGLDVLIDNAGIYSARGSADPAERLLDPGWVSTDMGGPEAPVTPAQSVAAMIRVIDGLTARHNGGFFTREGREAPW